MNEDIKLELKKQIGLNIKKYRKIKKLTQQELADLLEMHYSTIQKYENSVIEPSIITLIDISEALDITISELINVNIEMTIKESEIKENISYIRTILEEMYKKEGNNPKKFEQYTKNPTVNKLNSLLENNKSKIIFLDNKHSLETPNGTYKINESEISSMLNAITSFINFLLSKYEK